MNVTLNKIGQRFGKLVAISVNRKTSRLLLNGRHQHRIYLNCVCDCGNFSVVRSDALNTKYESRTKSCGCDNKRAKTHNLTHTSEYSTWHGMRVRCSNHTLKNAPYAGRGIKVCTRWDSFENFLADMGERPSATHSIERIDNDGDYSPDNCKWATKIEQANNRRDNVTLEFNGITDTIAGWSRRQGLSYHVIACRIRRGWSVERAICEPVNHQKRSNITHSG